MDNDTTYELWVQDTNGKWGRIVDSESKRDLWPSKKAAEEIAKKVAENDGIARVIGIKRVLSFTIPGKRNEASELHGKTRADPERVVSTERNPEGGA